MALRILTGVLVPVPGARSMGNATIHFDPHQISGDAEGLELNEIGDADEFNQPPGKIVSLRQVRVIETSGWHDVDLFQIDDGPPSTTQMVVRWQTTSGSEIHEISYMIVGNA